MITGRSPRYHGVFFNAQVFRHGPGQAPTTEQWVDKVGYDSIEGHEERRFSASALPTEEPRHSRSQQQPRKLFAPMRAAEGGSVIMTSSSAGMIGSIGQLNYATAKAGLLGMTRAAALVVTGLGTCELAARRWMDVDPARTMRAE